MNESEKSSQITDGNSGELGSIDPSVTQEQKQAALTQFETLDKEAYSKADELTGEYQKLMERFESELLPLADRMQSLLSQRGFMHLPGLPSWTAWRDRFIAYLQKNMKMSLTTFKRRLKEYQELDEPEESEEGNEDEGGTKEEEPVSYDSPKEQVTKWIEQQRKVLSGSDGPIDADPIRDGERRVDTSLQKLDELELAVGEGLLDGIASSIRQMPTRPEITGNPVAEPEPNTLEEFRQQLFRIPDTRDMREVPLLEYLNQLVAQVMDGHPLAATCRVSIFFSRASDMNSSIIVSGDWLEYKGGNARLTKQLGGKEIALGRVVGHDMLYRPCVRWFNGSEWLKPYSLFQEGRQVNVLFDYQAADAYPDAFSSYPKEKSARKKSDEREETSTPSPDVEAKRPGD